MTFKLKLGNIPPQPISKTANDLACMKATPQAKPTRDLLFGSGLTKRMAESGQKKSALNALSKKVDLAKLLKAAKQPDAIEDELPTIAKSTIAKSIVATLPSELMPSSIKLDQWQLAAVNGLRLQKYGVLIGAAGTGKTTTTRALLAELEASLPYTNTWIDGIAYKTLDINFASFMGKAVQQIKRAIPRNYHGQCSTLHALLEFKPVTEDYFDAEADEWKTKRIFLPTRTAANPLMCKCIVIDESGSVPVYLWLFLLDALPTDCRIYMLGDLNQLPPVGGHSILGFAMLKWPTYELRELHRNAGAIAEQAHRVIAGLLPQTDRNTKKVIVKKLSSGSLNARREVLAIVRHLYEIGKFDPMQDGLIVPQNIEALGQLELNSVLVNLFNPPILENGKPTNPRQPVRAGFETKSFGVGDKVMLLKNDTKTGLTNGMVGIITEININAKFHGEFNSTIEQVEAVSMNLNSFEAAYQAEIDKADQEERNEIAERAASHAITVHFADTDKEMTFATTGEINNITLAYAFTCHKAQGSEYRMVIVVCHSANIRMLCREWLYTAMTRAKDRLLILCNDRGLQHAVKTQRIKGKTLQEKAQKFLELQKGYDTNVNLPEPIEFTEGQFDFITQPEE